MDSPIAISLVLVFGLSVILLLLKPRQHSGYLGGISIWCRYLPVISVIFYLVLLGANLAAGSRLHGYSVNSFLSVPEMMVMFLAGPMFFTRAGNLIGLSTLVYLGERLSQSNVAESFGSGSIVLVITVTTISILADKMPWHRQRSYGFQAQKFRDIFLIGFGFISLAVIFLALLKLRTLGHWLDQTLLLQISRPLLFASLATIFMGWLGIILGISRHILIFVITIPTCMTLAFLTNWNSGLVAIPFAGLICLALASADQNLNLQRRQS